MDQLSPTRQRDDSNLPSCWTFRLDAALRLEPRTRDSTTGNTGCHRWRGGGRRSEAEWRSRDGEHHLLGLSRGVHDPSEGKESYAV